ncbi:cold shock domain-containing protein E1-like [Sardina pilchardus]|uniref:cold shock domain-containing protein E1-like n=1 Tax=Sardina pilchardus TaxID=27697 RepID=UPI002E13BF96
MSCLADGDERETPVLRTHHSAPTQHATPQCLIQATGSGWGVSTEGRLSGDERETPLCSAPTQSWVQPKEHHPVEGMERKLRFSVENVLQKASWLVGDKVQYEISANPNTQAERAVTVEILADTFKSTDAEEQQRTWNAIGGAEPWLEEMDVPEVVRTEHHEGTVLRVPTRGNAPASDMAVKHLHLGSLKAVVEGVERKLSFSAEDVLTKATMLVGDKVQFKISTNPTTKAERAVTVEILADTLQCTDTEERRTGVVLGLSNSFGYIKSSQDPKLVFDFCEVLEDKKLSNSERVEFTIVPNTVAGTGYQAIRIRRQKMVTHVPTLEAPTTAHSEEMFTPVPTSEGSTTTQSQKKITFQPTATKERMQKDTGINSDAPKTG